MRIPVPAAIRPVMIGVAAFGSAFGLLGLAGASASGPPCYVEVSMVTDPLDSPDDVLTTLAEQYTILARQAPAEEGLAHRAIADAAVGAKSVDGDLVRNVPMPNGMARVALAHTSEGWFLDSASVPAAEETCDYALTQSGSR